MAIGDVISNLTAVDAGSSFAIQPATGEEWVVNNIYYGGAVEFYYVNATNSILYDEDISAGARLNMTHHLTATYYMEILNATEGTMYIAYDGVITKAA